MAIKSLEKRKRQKILLIITIGLLLVAGVILYFSFGQERSSISIIKEKSDIEDVKSMILEKKLERINLDFNFLVETILPFLKSHGNLPIEKGETGRDNPFIPYWTIIIE